MNQPQLTNIFLDQNKDLIWIVNLEFHLVYANKAYLDHMKEVTGEQKKINESIFIEGFGKEYIEKWKTYYKRALKGECFEIEDHFFNTEIEKIQYSLITFKPITGENSKIVSIACQSKDITRIIKQQSEVKQLIDSSLDVFCTFNEQGKFLYVNNTAKEHWGYTPDELLGTNYRSLVIEEDLPATDSIDTIIRNGQEIKSFLNRYRKKNGAIAYNIWSSRWDERRKLIYAVARDGKEKFEQEEKLLKSEQRFKALVTGAFDLVAVLDTEGHYLFMSPSITAIAGIPPEEFIGKNAFDFVHPNDIKQTEADLEKATKEDRVIMKPYRAKNHKNEWRWVESILKNMLDNPAINGIVVNSRDITDKVEQEKQIVQAKKRFETLIENSTDCITILSPEGETIFISKAIENILGYTPSEAMELDIWEQIHPKDLDESKVVLSQVLENPGISIKGHISRMKHKNGSWRWVRPIVTNLIHDPSIGGIVDVISDVTKQKTEEHEKNLIKKINNIFNQRADNEITQLLSEVSEQVVSFDDFSFAEIWLPTFDNKKINRTASYTKSKSGKTFFKDSKKLNALDVEEGLVNQVLKNRETVIWESVDDEWNLFKRKAAAEKAGIKSLIAIPLIHNDKLLGGLLIGTEKAKSALSVNLALFKKLELTLGSELNRKKTEVELSQIFNFTPDMICVAGFDGYMKRINPSGLDLLGYSLEEIRSRPIKSFVHEEDQSLTEENQNKLYTGKNIANFENRYITKEGKVIWLSWTATSLPEQGIIYAVAKHVTEDKNLRELNRQVGLLVKVGSWEVDLVKQIVFWSDEVHEIHETNPKTFVPNLETSINFFKSDFREMVRSTIEHTIVTGESWDFEALLVTAKENELWIRSIGNAEFKNGKCIRLYGGFQDINERKQAENRLQSLADNIPGIIYNYAIYPDGTDALLHVAGDVEKIWGFTADQVIENSDLIWEQIKLGGDFEEVQASIQKSIQTKSKWINRSRYVYPTGEVRNLLGFGSPNFLADGTILFNSIILDNTQQAKNEELLEQVSKIARIGSWEMDLINQDGDSMYWSPMLFEIVEVDDSYNPTLTGGIEFHVGESKKRIEKALNLLITDGIEFDEEILLRTAKGHERWSRAIGKSELVNNKRIRIYGSYQDIDEQKTAALELQESLKELKDYKYSLDQSAIIAFTDNKGVITTVNDNFCEISKYTREEIIGKTHRLINSQHHPVGFFKDLWKTIASGKIWRGEIKNKAKDGSYYWVDTTIVPFLNKKNKPTQYLAIRFDITERKKAEDEKARFQETLENSLNEIYMFDSKTLKFGYVNKGAMANLGYSKQEIQNLTPLDIKPEHTDESFNQLVSPLLSHKKEKVIFFTKHKRKDGSLYPVEVHLKLVEEAEYTNFIAIILDITERKKAEEDNRFKANLLSMVRQGAIATDLHGEVNYWNKGAEIIYGWKAEEALGKNIMDLTTLETNKEEAKQIMEMLKKGKSWSGDFDVQKKDGTNLTVMITNSPIYDENNDLKGIIGISTDITPRKNLENKMVEYRESLKNLTTEMMLVEEKQRKEIAANIHDHLSQSLVISKIRLSDLEKEMETPKKQKEIGIVINHISEALENTRKITYDLSPPVLYELGLVEAIYWLAEKIENENQIKVNFETELTEINLSEPKLILVYRVIQEILNNAIKHSGANQIDILFTSKASGLQIVIKDKGKGFNELDLKSLRKKHTGFGLFAVKERLENLRGSFAINSAPGLGTEVKIFVPLIESNLL